MPRVSQEHLDARRRQIVEAALRCFARNGIHPTSMQDIFAEAGLSAGAVYRYFKTKESIVGAVVQYVLGMSVTALADPESDGAGVAAGHNEAQSVNRTLDMLLAVFDDPGPGDVQDRFRLVLQIWAEAARSPHIAAILSAQTDALRASIARRIELAQAAGAARPDVDPLVAARLVTALFEGYAFQRAFDPAIDTDAYRETARALLTGGLVRAS